MSLLPWWDRVCVPVERAISPTVCRVAWSTWEFLSTATRAPACSTEPSLTDVMCLPRSCDPELPSVWRWQRLRVGSRYFQLCCSSEKSHGTSSVVIRTAAAYWHAVAHSAVKAHEHTEDIDQNDKYSQVRDIWTVDIGTIRWDFWSVSNQLIKFSMETIIFDQWWRSHFLLHAKVYVFSDCVICVGKMNQNPTSNTAWERQLDWFKDSSYYRTLDTIDGEPMEFEWNVSPGFTTLQLYNKVKGLLLRLSVIRKFPLTDCLHVDVQRHLMGI